MVSAFGDVQVGVAKTVLSRSIHALADEVAKLRDIYVFFPSAEEAPSVAFKFSARRSWSDAFLGCMGAVDGTHLPVHTTGLSRMAYLNWHGWFSVNMMAVVDMDMKFRYVSIGTPGRVGDARVFRNTGFFRAVVDCALIPLGFYILGMPRSSMPWWSPTTHCALHSVWP